MIRANRQYYVVRIDKKLQTEKRNNLVSKKMGFLGIKHSAAEGDEKLDGVKVWDVEFESPAYHAAFKAGDIIKQINGEPVKTYEELTEKISSFAPNDQIEIAYVNSFSIYKDHLSFKTVRLGERKFEIVLPPQVIDFQFNLQFGEIVEVGAIAANEFPDAKVGDTLIFHHHVEHKPRTEGDPNYHDYHLVDTDENGDEYRIVNFVDELFGVWKQSEGVIIPYKKFIFCRAEIKKASIQKTASGLWFPDGWETTIDDLQAKIDETKAHMEEISSSTIMQERTSEANYKKKEEISKMLNMLNNERRQLSIKMNQKKFVELTVVFINPLTCEELQTEISTGDVLIADYNTLYPLDLFGFYYTLLRKDYIEAVIFNNQN